MRLKGCEPRISDVVAPVLGTAIRLRVRSFISQMQNDTPVYVDADDAQLVRAIGTINPQPALIPHYRALIRDVIACGFEIKPTGKSVSP